MRKVGQLVGVWAFPSRLPQNMCRDLLLALPPSGPQLLTFIDNFVTKRSLVCQMDVGVRLVGNVTAPRPGVGTVVSYWTAPSGTLAQGPSPGRYVCGGPSFTNATASVLCRQAGYDSGTVSAEAPTLLPGVDPEDPSNVAHFSCPASTDPDACAFSRHWLDPCWAPPPHRLSSGGSTHLPGYTTCAQ